MGLRRWSWVGLLARPGGAVASGVALLAALQWPVVWWLAPVGVGLLAVVVDGRRLRAGAGLGALCGLALFVPLVSWTNLHTGVVPWLLLAGSQAAFVALLGVGGAWCSPVVRRWPWLWGPVAGALWVAQEALRDRVPFGGFPWGRLAFGQGDSPLLRFAAWGGAPLVTFVVAVAGGWLAAAWWYGVSGWPVVWWRGVAGCLAGVLALVVSGLAVPVGVPDGRVVTVAVVQGNVPRLGLDFNAQRRAVLDNHVAGTLALARRVAAGEVPRPDLVVWPENSSDIDPLRYRDAAARIGEAAAAVGVPILVGAVLDGGDRLFNAGLVWEPGRGVTGRYVKRHPVPFAEYVPLRRVARLVSDQVDRVAVDFAGGAEPGVLPVGGVRVGDVICFEVAYDAIVRDAVAGGGQLLAVQTNNATFDVWEARQQLAMVRLRAVEHGRPALMASTVGISAFVGADGRVWQRSRFDTAAVLVSRVRLGGAATPATVVGAWPEYGVVVVALVGLVAAARLRRGGRRVAGAGGAPVEVAGSVVGSGSQALAGR